MSGTLPPCPYMFSWHTWGQIYPCFNFKTDKELPNVLRFCYSYSVHYCEKGYRGRYCDLLRTGRPGNRILTRARITVPVQTSSNAHATSCTMGFAPISRFKAARDGQQHPIHLAPKLKKERSCTSTPFVGFNGLLKGEVYFSQLEDTQ